MNRRVVRLKVSNRTKEVDVEHTRRSAEQLTHAVRAGEDAVAVAHEVGASAAADGSPLDEVLDLVERAFDGPPEHRVVRAACLAWSDHAVGQVHGAGCEDPLTSLATVPHLAARLEDVYREAAAHGRPAAHDHVLVVVELTQQARPSALSVSIDALEVGRLLREVYPGGETIARVGQARCAVLTSRSGSEVMTLSLIGALLGRAPVSDPSHRLWVEQLPARREDLPALLEALAR